MHSGALASVCHLPLGLSESPCQQFLPIQAQADTERLARAGLSPRVLTLHVGDLVDRGREVIDLAPDCISSGRVESFWDATDPAREKEVLPHFMCPFSEHGGRRLLSASSIEQGAFESLVVAV